MQPSGTYFGQLNVERMQQYQGDTFTCEKCGSVGTVGGDMVSAISVSHRGEGWFWWVHVTCADKYMRQFPPISP